jgi:hypothetical protein
MRSLGLLLPSPTDVTCLQARPLSRAVAPPTHPTLGAAARPASPALPPATHPSPQREPWLPQALLDAGAKADVTDLAGRKPFEMAVDDEVRPRCAAQDLAMPMRLAPMISPPLPTPPCRCWLSSQGGMLPARKW